MAPAPPRSPRAHASPHARIQAPSNCVFSLRFPDSISFAIIVCLFINYLCVTFVTPVLHGVLSLFSHDLSKFMESSIFPNHGFPVVNYDFCETSQRQQFKTTIDSPSHCCIILGTFCNTNSVSFLRWFVYVFSDAILLILSPNW